MCRRGEGPAGQQKKPHAYQEAFPFAVALQRCRPIEGTKVRLFVFHSCPSPSRVKNAIANITAITAAGLRLSSNV